MDTQDIKESLENAGFVLRDKGSYWNTNAIWRNGDNYTAIQIYKDTGVWRDYVERSKPMPFVALMSKALGTNNKKVLSKYVVDYTEKSSYDIFENDELKPKIEMEKVYDIEMLKDFLPHYKFYNKKSISKETLELYRSGYSTNGKMNNRFVFPIFKYRNNSKIIGFSGRSMLWEKNPDIPKWKHIGNKRSWIYPLCISDYFEDSVRQRQEVIIVESIGDSLALTENGFPNHIVTFGLDLSKFQLMTLLSFSPKKIIISLNNDESSSKNNGKIAAIKHFITLMDFFDLDKIEINLPSENDLSDLHMHGKFDQWSNKKIDHKKQKRYIYEFIKKQSNRSHFLAKNAIDKKIKIFANYFDELDF